MPPLPITYLRFEYGLVITGKLIFGNNSHESQQEFQHRIPEKVVGSHVIHPVRVKRNGYCNKVEPAGVPGYHKKRGSDTFYGRAIYPESKEPSKV